MSCIMQRQAMVNIEGLISFSKKSEFIQVPSIHISLDEGILPEFFLEATQT